MSEITPHPTVNLFLDDVRVPSDVTWSKFPYADMEWNIVRSYAEFVAYIEKNGMPDVISFDHDLADEHYTPEEYWNDYEASKAYQEARNYTEKTGNDCAKWLVEYCLDNNVTMAPLILVHSLNPVGADNIRNTIKGLGKVCSRNEPPTDPSKVDWVREVENEMER